MAVEAVAEVAIAVGAVAANGAATGDGLAERAVQIGEAWARDYVSALRAQERSAAGGWPGTMSEARSRIVARLAILLDPKQVDELARIANLAARRAWLQVCVPDPETD